MEATSLTPTLSPHALYDAQPPAGVARSTIDPFCQAFFDDPYPAHAEIRDAGPIVWLDRYAMHATGRHAEVQAALMDWRTFSSARGVGMADFERHGRFRLPSLILEADPPQHGRSRAVLNRALSPQVMRGLRAGFETAAEAMVAALVERGRFDAIGDLAVAYPLQVFPDAIGMERDGRDNLLPYGDLVFNSFGPPNAFFQEASARAEASFAWVEAAARRERLSADGFGMIVYEAADAGEITEREAEMLVRAILTAGVDTTVNGIGAAIYCLARFPEQWQALRAAPESARAAFDEAVRFETPVQTFFRTVTCDTALGGVPLREGEKLLLLLGSANRDPRRWDDPERYDIQRKTIGQVGYGTGIHGCVGQLLARLEGEAVLTALARQVAAMRIIEPPTRRFNNSLRGLERLMIEVDPATA